MEPISGFLAWLGSTLFSGSAFGAALIMYAPEIAYGVLVAGSVAYGQAQQRRMEQQARNQYNSTVRSRTVMIRSAEAPSPWAVGLSRLSGPIVYADTTGTYNEYLHLVIALARHECDAIEAIYFNEDELAAENPSTGMVESGPYTKTTNRQFSENLVANGSGVLTLTYNTTSLGYVGDAGNSSYDPFFVLTVTHTPGTNTISGLAPGGTYTVMYWYNEFGPLVKIRKHLGQPGQVADADLVADSGGKWTSSDKGTSTCYIYVRIRYDTDVFGSIGIPQISARVRGAKLYDPRKDSTAGGSGSHRVGDPTTWQYSTNTALVAAAYLRDQTFGIRSANSEVVASELIAVSNTCDEEVTILNTGTCTLINGNTLVQFSSSDFKKWVRPGMFFYGQGSLTKFTIVSTSSASAVLSAPFDGAGGTGKTFTVTQTRYFVGGALSSANSPWDNLEEILKSMAGSSIWVQGRWLIRAGAYESPTLNIDEDYLAGGTIEIMPRKGRKDLYNGVKGKYANAMLQYMEDTYPVYASSVYATEDGEQILATIDYDLVNDGTLCQRLGKISVMMSRQALTVKLVTNLRAYNLVPMGTVGVTLARYGWTSKAFVVLSRAYSMGESIEYVIQETTPTSYDWSFTEATGIDAAPNTDLPPATGAPSKLTGLSVVAGSDELLLLSDGSWVHRALATWNASTDVFVREGGRIEVWWNVVGSPDPIFSGSIPGDSTSWYVTGVPDGHFINVSVRAISSVGKASEWTGYTVLVQGMPNSPGWLTNGTGARVPGDAIFKDPQVPGVSTAWNAGVYSRDACIGACRARCVVAQGSASKRFVFGLSSAPDTQSDISDIDFALYSDGGAGYYRVYELNTQVYSVAGAPAAGDVLEVIYNGFAIAYKVNGTTIYQHSVDTGRKLYFDSSLYDIGVRAEQVEFTALAPAPRGNLLNPDVWVPGTSQNYGDASNGGSCFTRGSASDPVSESRVEMRAAPDGTLRPVWEATSADDQLTDGTGAPDGGFYTGYVPIDPSKMYRFSIWINASTFAGNNGSVYLGPAGDDNAIADIPTGNNNTNPYFEAVGRSNLVLGRWYLFVGFVLPANYGTTDPQISAIYDGITGERMYAASASSYKWRSSASVARMRTYQYYSSTGNVTRFWGPRIEMCDGNEPTISQLLAPAIEYAKSSVTFDNEFDASFGLNGDFNRWPVSQTYPSGWSLWANANGISKETSTVASGPNAIKMVTGGNDTGVLWSASFGAHPILGAYLEVTVAAYVVSSSAGAQPQVLVRLMTNAGFTTYRDTSGAFSTNNVGWQNMTLNAAVSSGETIYGVEIYLMGSWSGGGGSWTGTVIFDKVFAKVKQPKDTTQIVNGAVTSQVTANNGGAGLGWTNAASDYNPVNPGTASSPLAAISVTYALRERYLLEAQFNVLLEGSDNTIDMIHLLVASAWRNFTDGGNLTSADVQTIRQRAYVPPGSSTRRGIYASVTICTYIDPVALSWIVGKTYYLGGALWQVRAYNSSGTQIAPGATSPTISSFNFNRVTTFKS